MQLAISRSHEGPMMSNSTALATSATPEGVTIAVNEELHSVNEVRRPVNAPRPSVHEAYRPVNERLNERPGEQPGKRLHSWQQIVARVAQHPVWPVPIELLAVLSDANVSLQCVVHTSDALGVRAAPLADLGMVNICFSYPIQGALADHWNAHTRLSFAIDCLRQTALHELDEFLLVDGNVAQSPHSIRHEILTRDQELAECIQRRLEPQLFSHGRSAEQDGLGAWHAAIARISLHPAWKLRMTLGVAGVDSQDNVILTCSLWQPEDCGVAGAMALTALSRTVSMESSHRVQQLLHLVRHTVQRFFDVCLLVDGVHVLSEPVIDFPRQTSSLRSAESKPPDESP